MSPTEEGPNNAGLTMLIPVSSKIEHVDFRTTLLGQAYGILFTWSK